MEQFSGILLIIVYFSISFILYFKVNLMQFGPIIAAQIRPLPSEDYSYRLAPLWMLPSEEVPILGSDNR